MKDVWWFYFSSYLIRVDKRIPKVHLYMKATVASKEQAEFLEKMCSEDVRCFILVVTLSA